MTSLAETLQELQVSNGLDMAAVVSADGLVVDVAASGEIDAESICSVAANGILMMESLGEELGEGRADSATLEYNNHIVLMAPLDDDNLLVLLAGSGINLGRLRILLRRQLPELNGALQAN